MRSQREKNMEKLCEEIEKYCGEPVNNAIAARLSDYYGAYKALCMIGKHEGGEAETYAYAGYEKHHGSKASPSSGGERLTRQMADEWMEDLENEDGTTGPHWTMEKAQTIKDQSGVGGSSLEFWVALNATYSDLCRVLKKYNINTIDAYVDFAKALWLEDKDAVGDKLAAYHEYVSRH